MDFGENKSFQNCCVHSQGCSFRCNPVKNGVIHHHVNCRDFVHQHETTVRQQMAESMAHIQCHRPGPMAQDWSTRGTETETMTMKLATSISYVQRKLGYDQYIMQIVQYHKVNVGIYIYILYIQFFIQFFIKIGIVRTKQYSSLKSLVHDPFHLGLVSFWSQGQSSSQTTAKYPGLWVPVRTCIMSNTFIDCVLHC